MFKRIHIDNYKSFVNFDLRLQDDLTLLVGRNGAGKTAVLDVVYALRKLLDGAARVTDRDVFPPSSLTRWQERPVQAFRVELELDGDSGEYRLEVEHDRRERRADYVRAMRGVLDGLRGFRLEKVGVDTRALSGVFGDGDEEHEFRFHELSDGQRTLAALYAISLLTAAQGTALFIDEPVNYVGLREIQPWLTGLADASGSEVSQAVLCSHHPEVIDYLGADRGVLLWRDGTGPTKAESLTDTLGALAAGSPLRLSQLLARGWER